MIETSRRLFLQGLFCAPAIVHAANIMPIKVPRVWAWNYDDETFLASATNHEALLRKLGAMVSMERSIMYRTSDFDGCSGMGFISQWMPFEHNVDLKLLPALGASAMGRPLNRLRA